MSLYDVLTAAAAGRPPEPDGSVRVLPQHGPAAGVVAFSAHFVVCADVDPTWVAETAAAGRLLRPARRPVPRRARRPDRVGHRRAGRRARASRRPVERRRGSSLEEIEAARPPAGGASPALPRRRAGVADAGRWRPRPDRSRPGRPLGDGLRGRAAGPRRRSRPAAGRGRRGPGAGRRAHLGAGLPRPPGVAARGARRRLPPGLRRGAAPARQLEAPTRGRTGPG